MVFLLLVLLAALAFEYINGFHDTANAIATVVSTKVLTPRAAIMMATLANLGGAFLGEEVAKTIGQGQIEQGVVTVATVFAGLIGAIVWNLVTWWLGLPSSSSHALIGGLCGAAIASSHERWSVLIWEKVGKNGSMDGLWPKVIKPMVTSPVIGFAAGFLLMALITALIIKSRPWIVNAIFGKLQIVSAAWMALSHGSNDAQKTMGIITLALFTGTSSGVFHDLPPWLGFLVTPDFKIHFWVKVVCALTMAAGTAAGGWRIIKTMGHKMVRLQPVHGFAAETTAGAIIYVASHHGIPLSTTHVISTSILGVGAMKRFSAVRWGLVHRILWAWVLTIPISAIIAYGIMKGLAAFGIS